MLTPWNFRTIWILVVTLFSCTAVSYGKSVKSNASVEASRYKIALLIGHNKGTGSLKALQYAQQDAKKLAMTLQQLGGYRREQVHLLLSPTKQQLLRTMRKIRRHVMGFKKRGTFFFYYSGHAKGKHFQLGQEAISFKKLWDFAKALPVRVRVLLIDSCFAGRFLNAKGLKRSSTVQWVPPRAQNNRGVAILASSGANGRSYESSLIKGSLFTSSVLAGLRGAADRNADSKVSLAELWQYVYRQTLSHSSKVYSTIQRPSHRIELRGQGPLILSHLDKGEGLLILPKSLVGHIFIYTAGLLFQDIHKSAGKSVTLGLQRGRYLLRIRKGKKVGLYNIRLKQRQHHRVLAQQIKWRTLGFQDTTKGISENIQPNEVPGDFAFGFLLHYLPRNYLIAHGLGLSLALDSGKWLRANLGYSYGLSTPLGLRHDHHALHLRLGIGYGFSQSAFQFWLGGMLEPTFVIRQVNNKQHWNMGFTAGLLGLVDYRLHRNWALRLSLYGGLNAMLFQDNDLLTAPGFELAFGVLWNT